METITINYGRDNNYVKDIQKFKGCICREQPNNLYLSLKNDAVCCVLYKYYNFIIDKNILTEKELNCLKLTTTMVTNLPNCNYIVEFGDVFLIDSDRLVLKLYRDNFDSEDFLYQLGYDALVLEFKLFVNNHCKVYNDKNNKDVKGIHLYLSKN